MESDMANVRRLTIDPLLVEAGFSGLRAAIDLEF